MCGVVLCKSGDVDLVQVAGGVFHTGREQNEDVSGKKGYKYSSSCTVLLQLVR
jgi:hypothetical protein